MPVHSFTVPATSAHPHLIGWSIHVAYQKLPYTPINFEKQADFEALSEWATAIASDVAAGITSRQFLVDEDVRMRVISPAGVILIDTL